MTNKTNKNTSFVDRLDRFFHINERSSSISREVIAGLTTFAAMSYILVVNPLILSAAGMDNASLITATALSAIIGTLIMALWANLPVALAAGMGTNAIFAYTVVGQMGVSWQTALAMVFITGVVFIVLSLCRLREKIVAGFPREIRLGLQCGIGFFIAYLGMQNSGLIVNNDVTLIQFGNLNNPATMLAFIGLLFTPLLLVWRVPGAFLVSIALLTVAGFFIQDVNGQAITTLPESIMAWPVLLPEMVLAFDFKQFVDKLFLLLPIAIYFFMADFFSTASTLIGVSRRGKLLTPEGKIPKAKQAFTADAVATVTGAAVGTSSVTSYVESVAGIESGGRTGLTSLVVALMFVLAMFFWPLITIIPVQATAPTLVLVGVLMMEGMGEIDTDKPEGTFTPILMVLITACTFNIMVGLSVGCFVYTLIVAVRKEWSKITPMLIVLNITLIIYLVLNSQIS